MKSPTLLVSIFICFCIADLCHSQEEQFAGPFRLVVRQIDQCDDEGTRQVYASRTRINKVSRTRYLFSTNVTFLIPFDNNVTVEIDIAKFGNGGWKPHFMDTEFPHFCTSLKEIAPVFYNAILTALSTECPIQQGTYELIDLDMEDFKIGPSLPAFPYGKFRLDFFGSMNGTRLGCIRYFIDVVPRKQKKPR